MSTLLVVDLIVRAVDSQLVHFKQPACRSNGGDVVTSLHKFYPALRILLQALVPGKRSMHKKACRAEA